MSRVNPIRKRWAGAVLLLSLAFAGYATAQSVGGLRGIGESAGKKAAEKVVDKAVDKVMDGGKEAPPPGTIKFVGKNTMATANGSFKKWKFTKVSIDHDRPDKSVVEVEVDVESLDTGIKDRDTHLRTPDFFDVKKYPTATLKIHDAKIKDPAAKGKPVFAAKIDFDLHGVKKTYDFDFTLQSDPPMKIDGKLTVKRTDFGIGAPHNKLNPMSVQEDIPITFTATLPDKL